MSPGVRDLTSFQHDMIDRAFGQAVTDSEAGVAGPDNGYIDVPGRASVAGRDIILLLR